MRGTRTMLALTGAALLALTAGAAAAAGQPGEGKEIRLARATWDTGWFPAAVYQRALEKLGYEIDGPVTLDNPPFYSSVAQGDVDLWVNGWFPLHNTYENAFERGAEKIGYLAKAGALQGYLVDKASAEKYGITNIDDFKKPEIKEAFDANGDGKADLVACPPGWGCEVVIDHHMDAYDLRDHVNPITASYSASMADAVARYRNGEPILFYTWTPNWTVGELVPGKDVVWIEVPEPNLPEEQKQLEEATVVSGVEGCVADPCKMGWPANDIRPVANSEFLEANPAVRKLLEVMSLPIGAIYEQNARMNAGEDSENEILGHADAWIEANKDQVEMWLDEARAAAGS
ncbi:glycine betaine/L-proline ABC transporter substrate-binding protein ProX [Marinimicrococcus flavescens]|uniref:Glycine betaine/L-proline ABC transporter substrate-binding protein ProX n=1 Tax=Marinimicrococcus flavescens TaxID=3031815 RepID=A0AAP3XST3_9PROT|nr:glycine betaine/L-proline ABC transporter substrate-binding protein ProX [Marinimicrococcus flavescens]